MKGLLGNISMWNAVVDSKSPQTSGIEVMETCDLRIPYLGLGLGLGLGILGTGLGYRIGLGLVSPEYTLTLDLIPNPNLNPTQGIPRSQVSMASIPEVHRDLECISECGTDVLKQLAWREVSVWLEIYQTIDT